MKLILKKRFKISDEDFFLMLCEEKKWKGSGSFPLMPSEELQKNFTGQTGKNTLINAYDFYKIIKTMKPLSKSSKVLDFGCGWGRITRFWLNDVARSNIFGVDPWAEMIELCKDCIEGVNFSKINAEPPIGFQDSTFDLITAYSVFSHLNKEYTDDWINEFYRILKPKGMVSLTTRSKTFISYCYSLKKEKNLQQYSEALSKMFEDPDKALELYDSGEFMHYNIGGGGPLDCSFYGETIIPPKYFEKFKTLFDIKYVQEQLPNEPTQLLIILQKKK